MDLLQLRNPVVLWWLALTFCSVVHLAIWVGLRREAHGELTGHAEDDRLHLRMIALAGVYTLICGFRSVVPRADVQRLTLFDNWLASVLVGRTVATIAELAFVAQWALALERTAKLAGVQAARVIAVAALVAISVAECFSWYAVLSTNYFGHVVEESLWASVGLGAAVASALLYPRFRGNFQRVLGACIASALGYVAFMVLHDVPMYLGRWRADSLAGRSYLTIWEGLRDVTTRRWVTWDLDVWREEIPWMSFYFTVAVWFSLALCRVSLRPSSVAPFLRTKEQGPPEE
jgi:hypothetical protein